MKANEAEIQEASAKAAANAKNEEKGALYVRMSKEWLATGDQNNALEHWVNFKKNIKIEKTQIQLYTGSSKNVAKRQVKHISMAEQANRHFFMVDREEMNFDPAAEEPIVLIKDIPLLLAQALESATILLRGWLKYLKIFQN